MTKPKTTTRKSSINFKNAKEIEYNLFIGTQNSCAEVQDLRISNPTKKIAVVHAVYEPCFVNNYFKVLLRLQNFL